MCAICRWELGTPLLVYKYPNQPLPNAVPSPSIIRPSKHLFFETQILEGEVFYETIERVYLVLIFATPRPSPYDARYR